MTKAFLAAVAVLIMLTGCGGQSQLADSGANVLIRAGVAEFVGGEADTAQSVIEFTNDILAMLEGDPRILVDRLQEYADRLVPWAKLSPGQRIVAAELVRVVEARLVDGVTTGELPPDAVVRLRDMFAVAQQQARIELRLAQP